MEALAQTFQHCTSEETALHCLRAYEAKWKHCFRENVEELFAWIHQQYHNEGNSPWSDQLYDILVDVLRYSFDLVLEGEGAEHVGSAVAQQDATLLPFYMGSMNKYKTPKLVVQWMKKYKGPYVCSAKLDGISAMYVDGKLYTRGNGTHGRDISYLLPYLKMGTGDKSVRGELILKKKTFADMYKGTYSNARNLVCGLLNRKFDKQFEADYHNIDFVAYDIYDTHMNYAEKFAWLTQQGYVTVAHKTHLHDLTSTERCDVYLKAWKHDDFDYEIDGIIITNHDVHEHDGEHKNPDFAFAYKNNALCVTTSVGVVEAVLWNISKDNYLKPTIQLQSPILCDTSTVEYVTGFNAKYILDHQIRRGTRLEIGLSGNVIPHIFRVMEQHGGDEDGHGDDTVLEGIDCSYAWTKNHVDLVCTNENNYQRIIKQNMMFFNALGLKCNLQEKTLLNVYESLGVYELKDILCLSLEEWIKVDKMGEKKANGILGALYDALHWPELYVLLQSGTASDRMLYFLKLCVGLQCFSRGFAVKKVKLYVDYLMQLSCVDFRMFHDTNYIDAHEKTIMDSLVVNQPKQITSETMILFLNGFRTMNAKLGSLGACALPFQLVSMEEMLTTLCTGVEEVGSGGGVCDSVEFVFSGFRNKEWEKAIVQQGGSIGSQVSKQTNVLVVKDKTKSTSKTKKAQDYGVFVCSVDEFIDYCKKEYKEMVL